MPTASTASTAPTRAKLAASLNGGDALPARASLPDWLRAAKAEGVSVLLAQCWHDTHPLSVPGEVRTELAAAAARDLLCDAAEQGVVAALQQGGLRVLVLKGGALARWLYPHPMLRWRSDLDVLLQSEAELQACRDALAGAGYVDGGLAILPSSYATGFKRSHDGLVAHSVDVHWRLANHPLFAEAFDFDELWADSEPVPGLSAARGLGIVHALLLACLHRMANLRIDADKLMWLYDIHLLMQRMSATDWARLETLAVERRIVGPCLDSFTATSDLFASPFPDALRQRFTRAAAAEPYHVRHAASSASYLWLTLRRLRLSAIPGFLWRMAFPGLAYMRGHFGVTRTGQLPRAYVRRALTALRRFIHH